MTNHKQDKSHNASAGKKMPKAAALGAAGVAGAVIGAGAAVAATAVLSNKKTRDRVKTTLTGVKDRLVEGAQRLEKERGGMMDRMTNGKNSTASSTGKGRKNSEQKNSTSKAGNKKIQSQQGRGQNALPI